jgi:hypothetical protein
MMRHLTAMVFVLLTAVPSMASAPVCPPVIPPLPRDRPATAAEVACVAVASCIDREPEMCLRCGSLTGHEEEWTQQALHDGLILPEALDWLHMNEFFVLPQTVDGHKAILAICPLF